MSIEGMAILGITESTVRELIGNKYIQSFLTLALFFIFAKLAAFVAEKFVLKLTAKTKTDVDDLLVKKTRKPMSLLLSVLGIKLAIVPLKLDEAANIISQNIVSTLTILILAYVIIVVFDIILSAAIKRIFLILFT